MMDPYKILGVRPDATDDEIKQAYRTLVRKYHPDKYANTDLADMANEKMKEINTAYEEVQRMREAQAAGTSAQNPFTASHGAYTDAQGHQAHGDTSSNLYARVRMHINAGELDDARVLLGTVPEAQHRGEWHFLLGCILLRQNYIIDAQNHLDLACRYDPYNGEYRIVRDRLRAQTEAAAGGYRVDDSMGRGCGCSTCDICMSLACADCCCDCLCNHH